MSDLHTRSVLALTVGTWCHSLAHTGFRLVASTGCPHPEHRGLPSAERKGWAGHSRLDHRTVRTGGKKGCQQKVWCSTEE